MSGQIRETSRLMALAMIGAAAVTAQIVSGKATRDALFLTSLDYTALPTMLVATSVCSILLVALNTRATRRLSPATLVPATFAASGVLFVLEWLLRPAAPAATAVAVYLHISCAGPLLASGFWLVSTERFDPRTAKQRFGQIAGMGTLGGLLSAVAGRTHRRDARGAGAAPGAGRDPVRVRRARARPGDAFRRRGRRRRGGLARPAPARTPPQAPAAQRSGCGWWPRRRTCGSSPTSCCSARPARRCSTICSRRAPPRSSAAATSCCGSSPSYYAATSLLTFLVQVVLGAGRAGAVGHRPLGQRAFARALRRHRGQSARARLRQPDVRARRRDRVPRVALPHRLRAVLHADAVRRQAGGQVDHRRRLRPRRRRHRRRARPPGAGVRARRAGLGAPDARPRRIDCRHRRRQPPQDRLHAHAREPPARQGRRRRPRRQRRSFELDRHRHHSALPRRPAWAPRRSSRPPRRRRRCRPTCGTSCACARATAIASCRCCHGRTG